jgi:ectoine hydroxylase-related dioxygenase (phytanoyl-CoA dioxygenase family)
VGKLLLFPGWLQHSVKKNKTDDLRISISFNLLRDYWKNGESQDVGYI